MGGVARWAARGSIFLALALAGTAGAQVPGRPDLFAYRDANGRDVLLRWEPVSGAIVYRVYRTSDLAVPFALVASPTASEWFDVDGLPGPPANPALFYYYVTALNPSGEGPASNLAFRLSRTISDPSGYWPIGLPYRYRPRGPSDPRATKNDLCVDLGIWSGGGTVTCPSRQSCGPIWVMDCNPIDRALEAPGVGYEFRPLGGPVTFSLVGAHDPAYETGGTGSVRLQPCPPCASAESPLGRQLIALPWHARARTAADLCREIGHDTLVAVASESPDGPNRYQLRRHYCGTTLGDFPLEPGWAYTLVVKQAADWQPQVWP